VCTGFVKPGNDTSLVVHAHYKGLCGGLLILKALPISIIGLTAGDEEKTQQGGGEKDNGFHSLRV
jgi:hypothetical protein